MALAYDNTAPATGLGFKIGSALRSFGDSMIKAHQYRTTVRELSALSARELADLGVHRSNIASIAYDSVYN